jgi:hypothetical protein
MFGVLCDLADRRFTDPPNPDVFRMLTELRDAPGDDQDVAGQWASTYDLAGAPIITYAISLRAFWRAHPNTAARFGRGPMQLTGVAPSAEEQQWIAAHQRAAQHDDEFLPMPAWEGKEEWLERQAELYDERAAIMRRNRPRKPTPRNNTRQHVAWFVHVHILNKRLSELDDFAAG